MENCNDGRRKNIFCIAINLLDIIDIRKIMVRLHEEANEMMSIKEKAIIAVALFQQKADEQGIELKLIKKTKQI